MSLISQKFQKDKQDLFIKYFKKIFYGSSQVIKVHFKLKLFLQMSTVESKALIKKQTNSSYFLQHIFCSFLSFDDQSSDAMQKKQSHWNWIKTYENGLKPISHDIETYSLPVRFPWTVKRRRLCITGHRVPLFRIVIFALLNHWNFLISFWGD